MTTLIETLGALHEKGYVICHLDDVGAAFEMKNGSGLMMGSARWWAMDAMWRVKLPDGSGHLVPADVVKDKASAIDLIVEYHEAAA